MPYVRVGNTVVSKKSGKVVARYRSLAGAKKGLEMKNAAYKKKGNK